jgi:hypothetical protein
MYALGRKLDWSPWLAFGLGLAWGFSYYARARAQVHPVLAGGFHIPLIFLSLLWVVRSTSWRGVAAAALGFLGVVMAPHYYVVGAAFLTPFYLLFVYLQPETTRATWVRVAVAVLPAVFFLGFNLKFTVPPGARLSSVEAMPKTGETTNGGLHPFLAVYAARPIDFFTGNLGLNHGPEDINPLKTYLNFSVLHQFSVDPFSGNNHERTNGIHWLFWLLFAAAVVQMARGRLERGLRVQILFFVALGLFAFAWALPPQALGYGPSAWLYSLVQQIRVPSRAGIWVHFSVLMVAGLWLSKAAPERWRRWAALPLLLPALVVAEDPPFWSQARMAPVAPAFSELSREHGDCGVGMYFPFINIDVGQVMFYQFLARQRGTNCTSLNALPRGPQAQAAVEAFPATSEFVGALARDLVTPLRLQKLVRCIPLSFVVFDPVVPRELAQSYCTGFGPGWRLFDDGVCSSPQRGAPLVHTPDECL